MSNAHQHQTSALEEAAERWGIHLDGLTVEAAFALGRVAGITEQSDAGSIEEAHRTWPRRVKVAVADLFATAKGRS
jgi:hypothetical protein